MSDLNGTDNINWVTEISAENNFKILKNKLKLDDNVIRLLLNSGGTIKEPEFFVTVRSNTLKI